MRKPIDPELRELVLDLSEHVLPFLEEHYGDPVAALYAMSGCLGYLIVECCEPKDYSKLIQRSMAVAEHYAEDIRSTVVEPLAGSECVH